MKKLLILLAGALVVLIAASMLTKVGLGQILGEMVGSSFRGPVQFSKLLERWTPMLLGGLAVFVALRAGLFNIGVEGQITVGGLVAAAITTSIKGPGGILIGSAAAVLAGAAWAWPAAWLKVKRGAHEVISTIMLNNIALLVASYLIAGPMMPPGASFPATTTLAPDTRLPGIPIDRVQIPTGLLIALVGLGVWIWWLRSSVGGYELTVTGENPTAARFHGVPEDRIRMAALCGSGAIAGLCGAVMLFAFNWRFADGFSAGYGYDSLGVALLAGTQAWAILPSAFLFAVLNAGSTAVQLLGIPKGLSTVILAILIVLFAAGRVARQEPARA